MRMTQQGGTRHNQGKNRLSLISPKALWAIGEVHTMGAEKYAPRNWEEGLSFSETTDALLRHLYKWLDGHVKDAESGLHHLAHVAWNALALLHFVSDYNLYKRFDDRTQFRATIPNEDRRSQNENDTTV